MFEFTTILLGIFLGVCIHYIYKLNRLAGILVLLFVSVYIFAPVMGVGAEEKKTDISILCEPPIVITQVETVQEIVYVEKDIYELAEEIYGVPAELLEAIERWETGHYTSHAYLEYNNTHGAMINGELLIFSNTEESTMALARNLKYNYFAIGLTDIPSIQTKYCPGSDGAGWTQGVTSLMYEIERGDYS